MSGLLAARVLAESFERVTVLERDDLDASSRYRRGVPQARHTHGLLARGRQELEDLFPGLTDALVSAGALLGDGQGDCRWYNDGYLLKRAHSGLRGLLLSRPLLESTIRELLLQMPAVELVSPCVVLDVEQRQGIVTGVRLRRDSGSDEERLEADLVVDATGRGSHTPTWLARNGFPVPPTSSIELDLSYCTVLFDHEPADLGGDLVVVVGPTPAAPRFGVAIRQEGGRWTVTLGGYSGDVPPTDLASLRAFASTLPVPDIAELIDRKEQVGDTATYRFKSSTRRHYERLRRFPERLVVIGDAVCSFNPIYAQGMTVAAVEALALRRALADGDEELGKRFFRLAAQALQAPWDISAGGDLKLPVVPGPRPVKVRVVNAYVSRVQAAASVDTAVGKAFLEVGNLLARPESLLRPTTAARVLRARPRRPLAVPVQRPAGESAPSAAERSPGPL